MKMNVKSLVACVVLSSILFSCQKQDKTPATTTANAIPTEVINQLIAQGFSTEGVIAVDGGYVVENDIFLSKEALSNPSIGPVLRVGDEEQYHTTNLITALPRSITVTVTGLDPIWTAATDSAIARYNLLGMRLAFQRVASGGTIKVVGHDLGNTGVLGRSSGFPTSAGNPPDSITINNYPGTFGNNPSVQWLATIVAHELGHTIGFRHTDYKNRAYSCGGFKSNEGRAGVGAIWIPGTPTKPKDPNSWMLACTDGSNRPFNPNDLIALNYLYH